MKRDMTENNRRKSSVKAGNARTRKEKSGFSVKRTSRRAIAFVLALVLCLANPLSSLMSLADDTDSELAEISTDASYYEEESSTSSITVIADEDDATDENTGDDTSADIYAEADSVEVDDIEDGSVDTEDTEDAEDTGDTDGTGGSDGGGTEDTGEVGDIEDAGDDDEAGDSEELSADPESESDLDGTDPDAGSDTDFIDSETSGVDEAYVEETDESSDDSDDGVAAASEDESEMLMTASEEELAAASTDSGDTMYINSFSVEETLTGTEPFDGDDSAGNDSTDSNNIVRSFDTLSYTLYIEMKAYVYSDDESVSYSSARLCFAFVLGCSRDEAEFDTGSMAWMDETSGYEWEIVETTDDDGETTQILYCTYLMESSDGSAVVPGTNTKNVSIYVKGMSNGQTVTPEFYAWMDGNDVYGDDTDGGDEDGEWYSGVVLDAENTCADHSEKDNQGKEMMYASSVEITVSAALKMNIYLTSISSYTLTTYDFDTGNESAPFYGLGSVYGASYVLGVSVQLYNDTADKGLRGLEYPTGDITFDLDLSTKIVTTDDSGNSVYSGCSGETDDGTSYDFSTLLYSYGPCKGSYTDSATTGRTVKTIINNLPYNGPSTSSTKNYYCTDGGTWAASQSGSTISVTVSGYTIDGTFPITYTSATDKTVQTIDDNIGTIATAQFTFITPYYSLTDSNGDGVWDNIDADSYITDVLGGADVYITVSDTSLSATSSSGVSLDGVDDNSNQGYLNDDSRSITARVDPSGSYSNYIMYAERDGYNQSFPLTDGCSETGYDWAYQGQSIGIICGVYSASYYGNSNNYIIGYDDFVKIDADAVELVDDYEGWDDDDGLGLLYQTTESVITYSDKTTGSKSGISGKLTSGSDDQVDYYTSQFYPITDEYVSITVLYAVLQGGGNWSSEDAMRSATQDDENITWYDSLSAVPNGYSIVGLLFQVRGEIESTSTTIYPRIGFYAKIKDNAAIGSTYMLTDTVRVWTNRSLTALNMEDGYESTDSIPLRTDSDSDGTYETGYEDVYLGSGVLTYSLYPKYTKLKYNEDGSTSGGTPSGHNNGDTVLIVGYETNISIEVLNGKTTSSFDTASNTYNLDYGQNIADFSVYPTIKIDDSLTNISYDVSATTTIYATVTLPEGMSYVYGSSYYGGTYTYTGLGQRGTVTDGIALQESQKVSYTLDWGGSTVTVTILLTVTENSDGTTTLTYTFEGVPLSESAYSAAALSSLIYFSAYIESGTTTSWTLGLSCASSGDGDTRDQTSSNGNYAETSIIALQSSAGGISKTVDSLYNELDSEITWYVEHANSGSTAEELLLLDVLPTSGYEGTWTLSGLSFDGSKLTSSDTSIALWYTVDSLSGLDAGDFTVGTDESGGTTLSATDEETNVTWVKLCEIMVIISNGQYYTAYGTSGASYTVVTDFAAYLVSQLGDTTSSVTGWALTGTLGAGDAVYATETIKTSGNTAGNYYQNTASYKTSSGNALSGYATGWVLGREISGTVWWDADMDGVNDDDAPISGVTCILYVYDGEQEKYVLCTEDVGGNTITSQTTDSDGSYSFTRLAAGEYIVVFSDDDGDVLGIYNGATYYQVDGENDDTTNDGVALTSTGSALDTEVGLSGVDGSYAVAYSLDDDDITSVGLHSISDMVSGGYATNYTELVSHQDLGLVITGYELPKTGGGGTALFMVRGLALMAAAGAGYFALDRHRRRKRFHGSS